MMYFGVERMDLRILPTVHCICRIQTVHYVVLCILPSVHCICRMHIVCTVTYVVLCTLLTAYAGCNVCTVSCTVMCILYYQMYSAYAEYTVSCIHGHVHTTNSTLHMQDTYFMYCKLYGLVHMTNVLYTAYAGCILYVL